MLTGFLCGLTAAFLNAGGYLFNTRFLRRYHSPFRLLIVSNLVMMMVSLPILLMLYPVDGLTDWRTFLTILGCWVLFFSFAQICFFLALREIESSRLASLLGLKIVVLTLIFMLFRNQHPTLGQWLAVLMASGAAFLINWTGAKWELPVKGGLFVLFTLIGYSLMDICETLLVMCFVNSGIGTLKSSFLAASACYTISGVVFLPCFLYLRLTRRQVILGTPCALFWFGSQIALISCFALLRPVFANVILASRGLIAVLLGALLAALRVRNLDAAISGKQWTLRGIAAILMIAAIGLYSLATAKF